ncbi:Protein of unknown function [Algoriphagus alkaliphilus]|uniref:DUF2911 domain-containing protein n=1 Tax=Algoriphagus alkaliphilus TaxID=279824 RepID=A0A1G5Z0F8_9BACT|nr:DUF2911 domain-containing protein [Algoriphagus alkaliphilus]MBA4298607.1 DUF2911 domain-containing protein [Cyclobacterium sp.]SDA88032.1 Protein of unknown function [Algoriphagus alkaliphilus]
MNKKFNVGFLILSMVSFLSFGQQIQMPQASPSAKIIQRVGLTDVTVDYSRPSTKGRKIFGELVPYGEVWRTGANAATVFSFSTDVTIGGQLVPAGSYALYAIPGKNDWTIIFSKNTKLWGAIGYKPAEDQLRFNVEPSKTSKKYETFEIAFNNFTDNSAVVSMKWEYARVDFKIQTDVDPIVMADIQKLVIDTQTTDPGLLFQAGSYYFTNSKDLNQAYAWVKTSTDMDPKYWTVHLRAKIEVALGMKTEALQSANKSRAMAEEAKNPDYIALNQRLIKSIK